MTHVRTAGVVESRTAGVFRYVSLDVDDAGRQLVCRYAVDNVSFEEKIALAPSASTAADERTVQGAARLVFLLAGVSYFKTAAPPVIEVPGGLRAAELALLRAFYRDGLGEYAYRNGLDLSGVRIEADELGDVVPYASRATRAALVPFGGGLDSIVTVEALRERTDDLALFVLSREGDRFEAIEAPAAVTGLPVVRAERRIDDKVLRSTELGYRNGHVPVTGILSAIAVLAAALDGRDAVAMSNEWSASSGNLEWNGMVVNHQWSKGLEFEDLFRAALTATVPGPPEYFSWLRPRSQLWVAREFAALGAYHRVFRSCNRAFHIDRSQRLDQWCGRCEKCCFVDLVLSPFVAASDLEAVFAGREPLQDPELLDTFRALMGLSEDFKPFECVGDVGESRVAAIEAAARPDRSEHALVQQLAAESRRAGTTDPSLGRWLQPLSEHRVPCRYAPPDLLG